MNACCWKVRKKCNFIIHIFFIFESSFNRFLNLGITQESNGKNTKCIVYKEALDFFVAKTLLQLSCIMRFWIKLFSQWVNFVLNSSSNVWAYLLVQFPSKVAVFLLKNGPVVVAFEEQMSSYIDFHSLPWFLFSLRNNSISSNLSTWTNILYKWYKASRFSSARSLWCIFFAIWSNKCDSDSSVQHTSSSISQSHILLVSTSMISSWFSYLLLSKKRHGAPHIFYQEVGKNHTINRTDDIAIFELDMCAEGNS